MGNEDILRCGRLPSKHFHKESLQKISGKGPATQLHVPSTIPFNKCELEIIEGAGTYSIFNFLLVSTNSQGLFGGFAQ